MITVGMGWQATTGGGDGGGRHLRSWIWLIQSQNRQELFAWNGNGQVQINRTLKSIVALL
jgi:hypothetical protein